MSDKNKNRINRREFLKITGVGVATLPIATTSVAAQSEQKPEPQSVDPSDRKSIRTFLEQQYKLDSEEEAISVWTALDDNQLQAVNRVLNEGTELIWESSQVTGPAAYEMAVEQNIQPQNEPVIEPMSVPGYDPSAYFESVTARAWFGRLYKFSTNVFWLHSRRYGRVKNVTPNASGKIYWTVLKYRGVKGPDLTVKRRRWYCGYVGKFNVPIPGGRRYRPSIVTSGNYRGRGKTISENDGT